MTSTCCANHVCAKAIDVSEHSTQENVLCPLCKNANIVYCSQECYMTDWVTHACPNAFLVQGNATQTLFRPYYLEDLMTDKEWEEVQDKLEFEQSYLLQHRGANMKVTQQLIGPAIKWRSSSAVFETAFRRGLDPNKHLQALAEAPYTVEIRSDSGAAVVMRGTIAEDAIYENHLPQRFAKKELGRIMNAFFSRRKESSSVTLFPAVDQSEARGQLFPVKGTLTVVVTVNGYEVANHSGQYLMRTFGFEATRAFGKFLVPRLKLLFPGTDDAIKNIKIVRADIEGSNFVLFFEVPRTPSLKEQKRLREAGTPYILLRGAIVTIPNQLLEYRARGGGSAAVAPAPAPATEDETPPPPKDVPAQGESPKFVVVAPPSAPPTPPPSASTPPSTGNGGRPFSAADLEAKKGKLKASPEPPRKAEKEEEKDRVVGGVPDSLVEAMKQRRGSLREDEDTGEPNEFGNAGLHSPADHRRSRADSFFSTELAEIRYECGAMDLERVTGLAMALQLREAKQELPQDLENVAAVVQAHARALAAGQVEEDSVPLSVSTALYTVVNELYEQ